MIATELPAGCPWLLAVLPLAGYLVGSIPFGVIIARAHGVDLRKVGSGNVGATNVARVLGRTWGYLCFFLDTAKGAAPVVVASLIVRPDRGPPTPLEQACWLGAGCGAVLGHVLNPWLKFRGGKGVATALGVVLGVYPYLTWAGLCALGLWIAVTLVSRYVSLGSIVSAAAFLPLVAAFNWGSLGALWPLVTFAAAICALIIVRHRSNIRRLLAGRENKIGNR
jgi:glycerol-3-phosphate acyltransferase PlsY